MQLVLIYSRLYISVYIFRMDPAPLLFLLPPRFTYTVHESYLALVGLKKEKEKKTVYEASMTFFRRRVPCFSLHPPTNTEEQR